MVAPREKVDDLLAELVKRGPAVELVSEEDWEALRVRRFEPRFGVDFADKNYPQEAALEKTAVSFNKGCLPRQEVVCRLEMRGHVIKKIVPVRLAGDDAPVAGTEVRSPKGRCWVRSRAPLLRPVVPSRSRCSVSTPLSQGRIGHRWS